MTLCDKCQSKNGVQRIRFSMSAVYVSDKQEKESRIHDQTIDLCSVCIQVYKEYCLARMIYDMLNSGVDLRRWLSMDDPRFKVLEPPKKTAS